MVLRTARDLFGIRQGHRRSLLGVAAADFVVVALLLIRHTNGNALARSLVIAAIVVVVAEVFGLYRVRLTLSSLDSVGSIVTAVWVAMPFAALIVWDHLSSMLSWIALAWETVVAMFAIRVVAFALIRRRRRRLEHRSRTLIIGSRYVATTLYDSAVEQPEAGLEPVLVMSDDVESWADYPVQVVPPTADLAGVIAAHSITSVLVAFSQAPDNQLVEPLRGCDQSNCDIYIVPRLFEFVHLDRDMDRLHTVPLVCVRRFALRSAHWRIKRVISVIVSGLALLLLSPLLATVALIIKLQDPGEPVLFQQERIGQYGAPFMLYKFRSMRPVPPSLSDQDWNPDHALRVGRFGAFIRKFSIDELPQLWNVFRGDMTLVGPRPERPHFVDQFGREIPAYRSRHRVTVGLTGWAAIHGLRGDTSTEDRALYDNFYIENWSLWLDFKILMLTVGEVLFGSGR